MGVSGLLGGMGGHKDIKDEWAGKKDNYNKIQEEELVDGSETDTKLNYNIGIRALEWKGKSGLLGFFGYLNSVYFDKFEVKEKYPKTYEMFHTGLVPEVEKVIILDLDCQFLTQTKGGKLGTLLKPLFNDKKIFVKQFKIPKSNINYVGAEAVNISKAAISGMKISIDSNIRNYAIDSGDDVFLGIDSMSSYDQLCNDLFNIVYEDYMAKPKPGEIDFKQMYSFEKGFNQKFWRVRNGWFEGALRDKRIHKGWQADTYKMEFKGETWLESDRKKAKARGKDPDLVSPYKTIWAPKTKFHLDYVFTLDALKKADALGNSRFVKMWVDSLIRLTGSGESDKIKEIEKRIELTPERRRIIFELMEGIAPYILGEIKDDEGNILKDEDLW